MNQDDTVVANIQNKLLELESVNDCRLILAVESGSRAWGYASTTSDYDVRCIYCHGPEHYLSVRAHRDTIIWELNDVYDINGWSLQKALRLALRANVSVYEWADSPIVYRRSPWMDEFRAVTRAVMQPEKLAAAYLGMATSTYKRYLTQENPPYKEYFYALRPLLAARWVLQERTPAPVRFAELRPLLPQAMQPVADELLALRCGHAEKARGCAHTEALRFIAGEMAALKACVGGCEPKPAPDCALLDDFFRRVVMQG